MLQYGLVVAVYEYEYDAATETKGSQNKNNNALFYGNTGTNCTVTPSPPKISIVTDHLQ